MTDVERLRRELDRTRRALGRLQDRVGELEERMAIAGPTMRPLSMKPNAVRQRRHYAKKRAGRAEASP